MRFLDKEHAGSPKYKVGDRVRISPKVDVYGMMGAFVNKCGTIQKIETICGGQYEVAEIDIEDRERVAVVQTKHLEKA